MDPLVFFATSDIPFDAVAWFQDCRVVPRGTRGRAPQQRIKKPRPAPRRPPIRVPARDLGKTLGGLIQLKVTDFETCFKRAAKEQKARFFAALDGKRRDAPRSFSARLC